MNTAIKILIEHLDINEVSEDRKKLLQPLVTFITEKMQSEDSIILNFICTHNSRRSHLSQIWAQVMASYYNVQNVLSYSGGTEATQVFPKIIETLQKQGFEILKLSAGSNPVYAIKYSHGNPAIIGFSKLYHDAFNPRENFAAVLTCDSASKNCPIVMGADIRIPLSFEDPKISDGTPQMDHTYMEKSLEIAREMKYVFLMASKAL